MRDQIARDRADKEARAAAEKAASSSHKTQQLPAQQSAQSPAVTAPSAKKVYTTCRLQVTYCSIRLSYSYSEYGYCRLFILCVLGGVGVLL